MNEIKKEIPDAYAKLEANPKYSNIRGNVYFYSTYGGTLVVAEVYGIPAELENESGGFYGFHIHEGAACTGTALDPFADTKGHLNPEQRKHPLHAGDLPVLMSNQGIAWMAVYTARFYPEDLVGHTVVIHGMPDDYRSQPAGDSGMKIACGTIVPGEGEYHESDSLPVSGLDEENETG